MLREAVTAYEAALTELTRERMPNDWAMTQNSLGAGLYQLGVHTGDEAALRRALSAYEAALQEPAYAGSPIHWAQIQDNLGAAFLALGEHGDSNALRSAVKAYGAALNVFSQYGIHAYDALWRFDPDAEAKSIKANLARARALLQKSEMPQNAQ
jgi:hypothetical protein